MSPVSTVTTAYLPYSGLIAQDVFEAEEVGLVINWVGR